MKLATSATVPTLPGVVFIQLEAKLRAIKNPKNKNISKKYNESIVRWII